MVHDSKILSDLPLHLCTSTFLDQHWYIDPCKVWSYRGIRNLVQHTRVLFDTLWQFHFRNTLCSSTFSVYLAVDYNCFKPTEKIILKSVLPWLSTNCNSTCFGLRFTLLKNNWCGWYLTTKTGKRNQIVEKYLFNH